MSIIRCDRCSRLIDSDYDLECFCEVMDYGDDGATKTRVLCEPCRDDEIEVEDMEPTP
jgi:hypothetical protein